VKARAVTLKETARVKGRIDAQSLVVREGAWLSGPVASGEPPGEAPAAKPTPPPAAPRPPETPGA
jgi:cytoskeletal protein CcmA (bactofilin family)